MTTKEKILHVLRNGALSDAEIAALLKLPVPSIRRCRGELLVARTIEASIEHEDGAMTWRLPQREFSTGSYGPRSAPPSHDPHLATSSISRKNHASGGGTVEEAVKEAAQVETFYDEDSSTTMELLSVAPGGLCKCLYRNAHEGIEVRVARHRNRVRPLNDAAREMLGAT